MGLLGQGQTIEREIGDRMVWAAPVVQNKKGSDDCNGRNQYACFRRGQAAATMPGNMDARAEAALVLSNDPIICVGS